MLSDERQFEISEWILREGKASIIALAEHFGVSTETIRRDLNVIVAEGKIKKVHGGAVALRGMVREADHETRARQATLEKREIARRAVKLIQDNDVIAIDAGTCLEALAREIYQVHHLCIITPSLPVAAILAQKLQDGSFDGRVIVLGGTLNPSEQNTNGAATVAALERYHIDKAFVGATALSAEGLMCWNENDGCVTEAIIRQARFTCVLAESEKLGKSSFYRISGLDAIDLLITDDRHSPRNELQEAAKKAELEIEIVALDARGE